MRLTFKSVDTEKSTVLSIIWVGLLCAIEGLHSKRRTFREEEGILPADYLWSQAPTLSQVSNLLAYPAEFGLVNTSQLHKPIPEINLSLLPHKLSVLSLWRSPNNRDADDVND